MRTSRWQSVIAVLSPRSGEQRSGPKTTSKACAIAFMVSLVALALPFWSGWLATSPAQALDGSGDATLDFEAMHRRYVERYAQAIESETFSGDCYVYYNTSYYLHGMISAVEATRDEALLRNTMHYVDNMLSVARDLNGDGHLEWGTTKFGPGKELDNGRPWQLANFQAAGPIPRLAAVIMNDPAFKSKYEKDAQRYVDFVHDSIIQYWHIEVYKHKIPWLPKDLGGWGSYPVWSDKCSLFAQIATSLYRATGDPLYLDIATRVAKSFQRKLKPQGEGWIWDNGAIRGDGNQEGVPDTSHTNREPMMMVLMHEAGIVFSRQDLERLAHTLTDTLWNGSLSTPRFSNYINGSNNAYRDSDKPYSIGNIYAGWALVGGYSSKAQEVLSHTLKAIDEGQTIGQNRSSYGYVALSGHLLRNSQAPPQDPPTPAPEPTRALPPAGPVESQLGPTYYVAPNGSDANDGSATAPWGSLAHAVSQLQPGDTLNLKDGAYRQSLYIPVSGMPEKPITIKAEHDGRAIVDGEHDRIPFHIDGRRVAEGRIHDIVVEGVRFQNSSASVIELGYADRVTLRRVSAYNAAPGNNHVFSVWKTTRVLLEDAGASGAGRTMYTIWKSDHVVLRRCWGQWRFHSNYGTGSDAIAQVYGTSNAVYENCVGTRNSTVRDTNGPVVWANTGQNASENRFYGNVMYDGTTWGFGVSSANMDISGNEFVDNVAINGDDGFLQRGDSDLRVDRLTVVGADDKGYVLDPSQDVTSLVKADVRNSVFLNCPTGFLVNHGRSAPVELNHSYNNLYNVGAPYIGASQGAGEISVDPGYNTTKYGKGAYLMRPSSLRGKGENGGDMGAEVLYRYVDGKLTDQPLWPWPMEERIFRETEELFGRGVSVTWEAKGGLWKTLEGVYP